MVTADRWSLVEYGTPRDLVGPIAESVGLTRPQVREFLLRGGARAGEALGFSVNPIILAGDLVRAVDIAGLLRIAPGIEIEVAPKFLGIDSVNPRWREDFFFLATLSRHGRLLASDRLRASSGERGDLHILVARSMIEMYWSNHRRPLRSYRRKKFTDFAFDGDVEPEAIVLRPESDGFDQSAIVYDRRNPYNAIILAAARELLPNLRDPTAIAQLERMNQALAPQQMPGRTVRGRRLPGRAHRWQPLYDLSVDVLRGFGLSYSSGSARAPGYVLDTWRVWEDLMGIALRLGVGSRRVRTQPSAVLGIRHRIVNGVRVRSTRATVTPDLVVSKTPGDDPIFLVDAKYKGHVEDGRTRISEADLYEALAFSKATGCDTIALVYPALPSAMLDLGQVEPFERVEVGTVSVIGVEVQTKGISSVGGLAQFAHRYAADLQAIATATQ